MRIVVSGLVGQYAFGGVSWDYLQYVFGFRSLGYDTWYLEDSANWAYDPVKQSFSGDCSANVAYLDRIMRDFDLGDRWIYRNEADGKYHGVEAEERAERILREADVLVNVSGACWLREPTARIPRKLFLDGDPMFTQVKLVPGGEYMSRVCAHDAHFSFGLNIGHPGCRVPEVGITWRPTVQPIAMEHWRQPRPERRDSPASDSWTTVMNWASYKPVDFQGESYGQKDVEFLRFVELPERTRQPFVLAMGQGPGKNRPTESLKSHGWAIVEPDIQLPDYLSYRDFLSASKGEWSVAKNGYVKSRSGWFSCRSACYLAAGKPVVVQDTGWSEHLPSGEGVLKFETLDEAAAAISEVALHYDDHCAAARKYALEHFEAAKVCAELLE